MADPIDTYEQDGLTIKVWDGVPTDAKNSYILTTADNERGEDTAIRWAKSVHKAKVLHKIKQTNMIQWKVEEDK